MCELEKSIAYNCGPAMSGIKASNLMRCCLDRYDNAEQTIHTISRQLASSGISMRIVKRTHNSLLLLVYRHSVMSATLRQADVRQFLAQYGYDTDSADTEQYLLHLEHRINSSDSFPHEIGIFLGYPLQDVVGFIANDRAKYSGLWKVYGDVTCAKAMFEQFDRCHCGIMRRIQQGHTLSNIFSVAI